MRRFNYEKTVNELVNIDTMNLISAIHEYKGLQKGFTEAKEDILITMVEIAKIQSTSSSNNIEGIHTSERRMGEIMKQKAEPRNRNEMEIAGYRDVLTTIHENYQFIPPRPGIIQQLHRDLYKYNSSSIGGSFKNTDNVIEEIDRAGNRFVRFLPTPAAFTAEAVDNMCNEFSRVISGGKINPLLLIPVFVLDFLCIHPFNDGNGRMSRLLTLLLLYRSGYNIGKYISIEMLIEKSKETYYEALHESSIGWHEGENNYEPFVTYMLGVILRAYREFDLRMRYLSMTDISKPERIELIIKEHLGTISKSYILELCPDISESTVEQTLHRLLEYNRIIKIGGGRYSKYVYNHDMFG